MSIFRWQFSFWGFASCCMYDLNYYKTVQCNSFLLHLSIRPSIYLFNILTFYYYNQYFIVNPFIISTEYSISQHIKIIKSMKI
jgi:hypothetical protein